MKGERGSFRMLRREQLLQELRHDSYKLPRKLAEPTRCPDCAAVYRDGRWQWSLPGGPARKARCPACQRIHDHFPAGYVRLSGAFFRQHRGEILRRVRHCEEAEKAEHALERIMQVAADGDGELVTTTGVHLARRIADALEDAFKGQLEFRYSKKENVLRVAWSR